MELYLCVIRPLLQPGRDSVWIMAGRVESNIPKIKKALAKGNFHFETFYLCYNTKQMQQYNYWRQQRGLANSKSMEHAFFLLSRTAAEEFAEKARTR